MDIRGARALLQRGLAFTGEGEAEAAEIICRLSGLSYSEHVLRGEDAFAYGGELAQIIERRRRGVPLAYILNSKFFYGREFYVDENVLIPRADTECVAAEAIRLAQERGYESLLDLCCGSGCIGVTVAAEGAVKSAAFSDVSAAALKVAQKNAGALLAARCGFYLSDLFESIDGRFDIIVCNPPYISESEYAALEPQVRCCEPVSALLAGAEGMEFYTRIAKGARRHLNPGGALLFETGCNQLSAVRGIMRANGMKIISEGKDLAGRDRFISGAYA